MWWLALALPVASTSAVRAASPYRDGWTVEALRQATDACTDRLVDGAWENSKREQGVDPARPLTPEIRKQLAPQIEAFRALCRCTIEETAKRFGKSDHDRRAEEMERYAVDLVKRGTCKGPQ